MKVRGAAWACWFVLSCGCGKAVVHYVDPPIDLPDLGGYVPEGVPTLELGFYHEQLYAPLRPDDGCPIVFGLQGGTWTMPAIRATGVDTFVVLTCSLTTDGGEVLGSVASELNFVLAVDGWLETQSFPVPLTHEAPNEAEPIDDLYGVGATLRCDVVDDAGRAADASVHVTMEEG